MSTSSWDALLSNAAAVDSELPDSIHEALAEHQVAEIRHLWLTRTDCPSQLLDRLAAKERNEKNLITIAAHPNLGERGRRILADHPRATVAVTIALRSDCPDKKGVAIIKQQRRSALRSALDLRITSNWVRQPKELCKINPDLLRLDIERWWSGLSERPLTTSYVARYIPLWELAKLVAVVNTEACWREFEVRLYGLHNPADTQVLPLILVHAAKGRTVSYRMKKLSLRNGGLLAAYVNLCSVISKEDNSAIREALHPSSDVDAEMWVTLLSVFDDQRMEKLLTCLENPKVAMLVARQVRMLSEEASLALIRLNIETIPFVLNDKTEAWSVEGIRALTTVLNSSNSGVQRVCGYEGVLRAAREHLDVLIAGTRSNTRLLRVLAGSPVCTLELALLLPAPVAFSAYHDPTGLAEWVTAHVGENLDVLSTLSTQYQGSVNELVQAVTDITRS